VIAGTMLIGALTVVVNALTGLRELVVAHHFGTGDVVDAFIVAFLLPSFVLEVAFRTLSMVLVSTHVQVREQDGPEAAQRLFEVVSLVSMVGLLGLSALLWAGIPEILHVVASGFSPEKLRLTTSLFRVLLPVLFLGGVSSVWSAVLNAHEWFAAASLTPALGPALGVVALIVGADEWGIYALAVGTVAGYAAQTIALGWSLLRRGISPIPKWGPITPALRQMRVQSALLILSGVWMSSSVLVDQLMASMLGSGNVAALGFGRKITAVVLTLGCTPLSTALQPIFSRMIAVGDWRGVRATFRLAVRLIVLLIVPLAVVLIVFSEPIVRMIFERGAFSRQSTHLVALIQTADLLQLPFYVLCNVAARLLNALNCNQFIMLISAGNLAMKIALNVALIRRYGVVGMALSTSIVYAFSALMMYLLLERRLSNREAEAQLDTATQGKEHELTVHS
jgi:putative peptidoglycan lipid II flippase